MLKLQSYFKEWRGRETFASAFTLVDEFWQSACTWQPLIFLYHLQRVKASYPFMCIFFSREKQKKDTSFLRFVDFSTEWKSWKSFLSPSFPPGEMDEISGHSEAPSGRTRSEVLFHAKFFFFMATLFVSPHPSSVILYTWKFKEACCSNTRSWCEKTLHDSDVNSYRMLVNCDFIRFIDHA